MTNFDSVLGAAEQLPTVDRLRLIEALWDSVPSQEGIPLHADWEAELAVRVASIDNGTAKTVPWSKIRDEALTRIGYGNIG